MDGDKNVDMVNHPPHYGNGPDDPYEHIKIMEATLSRDEFVGAMKFTIGRYWTRLNKKGDPLENARKAQWYTNRLVEYMKRDKEQVGLWFRDVGRSTIAQTADDVANTSPHVPCPGHPGERMTLMGLDYNGRVSGDGKLVWVEEKARAEVPDRRDPVGTA